MEKSIKIVPENNDKLRELIGKFENETLKELGEEIQGGKWVEAGGYVKFSKGKQEVIAE